MAEYVDRNQINSHSLEANNWFSADELLGLGGLPASRSGIYQHAITANWKMRQRCNVKGVTLEYHISNLSVQTQLALARQLLEDQCAMMPHLYKMPDDTMQPTIPKYAQLIITYLADFIEEGVYVVMQEGVQTVRRVQKNEHQQYNICCDNCFYQQEIDSYLTFIARVDGVILPV
ncbi:MAG: DNA-binding protein [Saezia sp.]